MFVFICVWVTDVVFYAMWKLFQQTKLAFWRRKSVILHLHSRYLADAVFQGNLQNCFSIAYKTIVINRWHACNLESYLLESKCFLYQYEKNKIKVKSWVCMEWMNEGAWPLTTFMLGCVLQVIWTVSVAAVWCWSTWKFTILFLSSGERERGRHKWRAE